MDAPVEAAVEAPEAVEAPTNIDALPDATEPASFEASLEAAFASMDQATAEPEPVADETESVEPEPVEEVQDTDPIESLTDDIGDDWTPKAANRFKELKTELKTNRSELDMLRQQSTEYQSKIQELTGLVENKDVEQLQERLAEYEQQQALTNLEQTPAYYQETPAAGRPRQPATARDTALFLLGRDPHPLRSRKTKSASLAVS